MDSCIMCGQCSAVCPKEAIALEGFDDCQIEKTEDIRLNPDAVLHTIRFRRMMSQ